MSKRVVYQIDVVSGPTAITSLTILHGIVVLDCWLVKTTGAGGPNPSVQLQDGNGNNISELMDLNIADEVLTSASILDDAFTTVNAAEGLQASMVNVGGANTACSVLVAGFPTPTP